MIQSKRELKYYLKCDKMALMIPEEKRKPSLFDNIWKYEIALRKSEYHMNQTGILHKFMYFLWYFRFKQLGVKLNIEIWPNQFGPGLSIAHSGMIVVNGNAKIGNNCRIHEGVTIGATDGSNNAAKIGDNVFIGSGVKIIGEVSIGDNNAIGAGAVVISNFTDNGVSIAGVPAKIVSHNGSEKNLIRATEFIKK